MSHAAQPPEAEMALLSALCLGLMGLHNIAGIVNADYFYSLKNRHIFRASSALIAEGKRGGSGEHSGPDCPSKVANL